MNTEIIGLIVVMAAQLILFAYSYGKLSQKTNSTWDTVVRHISTSDIKPIMAKLDDLLARVNRIEAKMIADDKRGEKSQYLGK